MVNGQWLMVIEMKAIKVIKILSVYVAILCLFGCEKDDIIVKRQTDDKGVVIATPYLWKTSLHQNQPVSNRYIKNSIVYNENIAVPRTNGTKSRMLSLINSKDGKEIWNWTDFDKDHTDYIDIYFHYQYKNLLTYQDGGRSYCINLIDGSTHWKHRRGKSFGSQISSMGQYYFTYAPVTNSDGFEEHIAYKGNIHTGDIYEFLTANFTYEHPDCVRAVNWVVPVPEYKHLLLVTYAENLPDWITQIYFGLYHTEQKEWIWDKMQINPPQPYNNVWLSPQIENNKIYAAVANAIVCHDLITGKQLWKQNFDWDFLFTGYILEDGRVIANNEDGHAYALDTETGTILWKVRTAGTSSRMSYLNGMVYFVGGSQPYLFAIEASTGKIVWKINAALLGEGYGAGFRTNAVYVLPAKDDQPAKVIALSHLYAYCFKVYR